MNDRIVRAVGVGLVAAAALVLFAPGLAAAARPMARRGIKAAVKAYERGREAIAEAQELAEDAYAEAWAELREEADTARRAADVERPPADAPMTGDEPIREGRRGHGKPR